METTYCCPKCGEILEQGQYWYDLDTDTMRVDHCPECDCEYGEPCEIHDDDDITYCCPECGEVLEQGQYWYDLESDTMRVDHCPNCDCEYGEPCEEHDNE